jgi:peptidoglycan hydrolase-like protein with peptidoglycan-binding domain
VVAVPDVLIQIHPEWRGHEYFVVRDDIIIVDSGRRIVATLPMSSSSSSAQIDDNRGTQAANDADLNLTSDEIRQMQIVLRERGFDVGEPDGVFGPRTREALVLFQRRNGLQATGRIDVRTTTALGVHSSQQGNQGTGTQQSGQTGGRQPSGSQPSANQAPNEPSRSSGQNNRGGSTTGQGQDNMQQPQTRENRSGNTGDNGASSPRMNQNNQNSQNPGGAPISGGQSK